MPKTVLKNTVVHMAMELSNKEWKLGFQANNTRRFVSVPARDLAALEAAIASAKTKLDVCPDARVVSCYEAGRDGFWLHRALIAMGVENLVVDPASIEVDRRARRKKTDNLDVKKLLKQLVRHYAGEEDVWSVVRVPSPEVEDGRRNHRERDRLVKERVQHSNRIKALLIAQGIALDVVNRWLPQDLEKMVLWDGSPIPAGLKGEILREHKRWLLAHEQITGLEKERKAALDSSEPNTPSIDQARQLTTLRGVGLTSAWKLAHEFFWRDFQNRREVGAAAGLTGTPYSSGASEREQGISKAGSSCIRATMVELGWSWLRFQPQSELSQWFMRRFGEGKRIRKIGIVALARRLLIALWRYATAGVVPAGADFKLKAAA